MDDDIAIPGRGVGGHVHVLGSFLGKRAATLTDEQKVESEMTMCLQEMANAEEEDPQRQTKNRFPFMAKLA